MSPAAEAEAEIAIEGLGARGDGVGRAEDGAPIYAAGALPGERVRGRVGRDGARVVLTVSAVTQPSPARVAPPCRHAGAGPQACGGCALQHADPAYLAAWKRAQTAAALAQRGLDVEVAPTVSCRPGTRRRVSLTAARGRDGAARLGFNAARSRQLVEIEACMVARPEIVAALPALRALAEIAAPRRDAATLSVTVSDAGLDVAVRGARSLALETSIAAAEWAEAADVARLSWNGDPLAARRPPRHRFGRSWVTPPAGGFLQATADGEAALVAEARAALTGARRVADLFCGAGAFALPLAESAAVLAADADPALIEALRAGWRRGERLKPLEAQTRDLSARPFGADELAGCDGLVFDPPRAGAAAQAAEIARSGVAVVVGISCNPATFARDARLLVDGGYRLERVTPVDQFLWSPHIELAGVFRR